MTTEEKNIKTKLDLLELSTMLCNIRINGQFEN